MSELNQAQFGEQHVPLIPVIGAHSFNQLQKKAKIQMELIVEAKDIGTWYLIPNKDAFKVWDGEDWLEFPKRLPVKLNILPHNMTERFNADEIEYLKEVYAEMTDEEERLALRQMLEEQQSGRE
jgi:hypothetical protein